MVLLLLSPASRLRYVVFPKYCIHHIDVGLLITQEMVTSVAIVSRDKALREYVPLLALVTGFCLLLLVLLYNTNMKGGARVFFIGIYPNDVLLHQEPLILTNSLMILFRNKYKGKSTVYQFGEKNE